MADNPAGEWQVRLLRSARRDLAALEDQVCSEALDAIHDLAEDPFPNDCLWMRGYPNRFRIKLYGNRYRLIYDVSQNQKMLKVLRVRLRKDAYRGL